MAIYYSKVAIKPNLVEACKSIEKVTYGNNNIITSIVIGL